MYHNQQKWYISIDREFAQFSRFLFFMFINSTEKSRNSKMINNGILEGLNSPIWAAKAKARGYRNLIKGREEEK